MLKVHVGLSKKVGLPKFGSRGATVNLEAEVENSVIQDPERLRQHLRRLFELAKVSLEEELNSEGSHDKVPPKRIPVQMECDRPATANQCGAIVDLAQRNGLLLSALVKEQTGKKDLAQVSLVEASRIITHLRSLNLAAASKEG